jgi:carboxyl-terminal processing protease
MLIRRVTAYSAAVIFLASLAWPQTLSKLDRDRTQDMLWVIGGDIRKHYYDPKFHGLNWDAVLAEAKKKIETTTSMNMALSHVAAALDTLNDSHTFFLPPQHANRLDYGWQYQMIGDRCFVTQIRPKSDAETKGVKPGDEIVTLNGYSPTRENLWKMQYVYSVLRPQPGLRLGLQDPAGAQRTVDVVAKIKEGKRVTDLTGAGGANDIFDLIREQETAAHLMRARSREFGDQLLVLKIPEFDFSPTEVGGMIDKARKHQALIVDLRGNPGGSVDTLRFLLNGMFDKEVKIADRVGRKETKPEIAKGSHNPFSGKVVVLVDSTSASASELFARVMQLEKRGTVMGDRSSGSVMESRHYREQLGADTVVYYGASITEWDLVMTDGKSLEHRGVTPDEIVLPSADDLAGGRDPVMARAAESLGVKLSAEEAGKLFPFEWAPQ